MESVVSDNVPSRYSRTRECDVETSRTVRCSRIHVGLVVGVGGRSVTVVCLFSGEKVGSLGEGGKMDGHEVGESGGGDVYEAWKRVPEKRGSGCSEIGGWVRNNARCCKMH